MFSGKELLSRSFRSAYHHRRLLLFIPQQKATCKEPWNQDLTDHRALREQLRTIRIDSLEEGHGRERDWKAEKNVTEMENHSTVHYNSTKALTHWQARVSKSMTKPEPRTKFPYNVQTWHGLWIYSWLSEQTSVRITYFLQISRRTFDVLEQVTFQQVITTCTCVAKLPNKKIWL